MEKGHKTKSECVYVIIRICEKLIFSSSSVGMGCGGGGRSFLVRKRIGLTQNYKMAENDL